MYEKIMETVLAYFKERNWNYEQRDSVIDSGVQLASGKISMLRMEVQKKSCYLMCGLNISIPEHCFTTVLAYANEINSRLAIGGLYLDKQNQVLLFRTALICADNAPTLEQIDAVFGYSISFTEDMEQPLLALLEGKVSPETASAQTLQHNP